MTPLVTACTPLVTTTPSAYFISIPKLSDHLTHIYYVVHRERYGIEEIIKQEIIKNPNPSCSLEFEKEWLEKYRDWSLTIQGLKQQERCFKITIAVANCLRPVVNS